MIQKIAPEQSKKDIWMTKDLLYSGGYGSKTLSNLDYKVSPVKVSVADLGKNITALDVKVPWRRVSQS